MQIAKTEVEAILFRFVCRHAVMRETAFLHTKQTTFADKTKIPQAKQADSGWARWCRRCVALASGTIPRWFSSVRGITYQWHLDPNRLPLLYR